MIKFVSLIQRYSEIFCDPDTIGDNCQAGKILASRKDILHVSSKLSNGKRSQTSSGRRSSYESFLKNLHCPSVFDPPQNVLLNLFQHRKNKCLCDPEPNSGRRKVGLSQMFEVKA